MKRKLITLRLLSMTLFSCEPVTRYVGEVVEVDSWNGDAKLKTKTNLGKDTIIYVVHKRHEEFVVGQVITCWCGGAYTGCNTNPKH